MITSSTNDPDVTAVLLHAYTLGGFTTRSDYARLNAEAVAAAAILGFITTEMPREGFGSVWRPTPRGLDVLFIDCAPPSHLYATGQIPASERLSIQ